MIRVFASDWTRPGRHRVSAFLLAICLNLAIVPCTMAFEVVEKGHDCCPPEVQFEVVECCDLGDISVDARFGAIEPRDAPDLDALPAHSQFRFHAVVSRHRISSADPPDPPCGSSPLYDLYCVYLK